MEDNIKKIVELEIDLDNLELEEMGVQVVTVYLLKWNMILVH